MKYYIEIDGSDIGRFRIDNPCKESHGNCVLVLKDEYNMTIGFEILKERPQWIPLTYRPMDEDEYRAFNEEYGFLPVEERKTLDCQMPEDGQEILISTKYGHIFLDACVYEDGIYGLEEYGGWDDVLAWMPIPEPYNGGETK